MTGKERPPTLFQFPRMFDIVREYGILIGSKVLNTLGRYSDDEHEGYEVRLTGAHRYPRRAASRACGVSMSRKALSPSTGTSATASACLAIR